MQGPKPYNYIGFRWAFIFQTPVVCGMSERVRSLPIMTSLPKCYLRAGEAITWGEPSAKSGSSTATLGGTGRHWVSLVVIADSLRFSAARFVFLSAQRFAPQTKNSKLKSQHQCDSTG